MKLNKCACEQWCYTDLILNHYCRNQCKNRTLCMEKLSLVLQDRPPYTPRQFGRCAVIGNSGDLLKTKFGKEIDSYDVVVRENGAPIEVSTLCCSFPLQ